MERYSHLQTMPNSPLTPLTPLSENTKFEFNFGGDGSLDVYIDSVRQEHRIEQQQMKLLQQANKTYRKKVNTLQPRRFSEQFLKLRDVFENTDQVKAANYYKTNDADKYWQKDNPNNIPKVKIIQTECTYTPNKKAKILIDDYDLTPTNIRTPLKPRNSNVPQNIQPKAFNLLKQQKLKQKCHNIIQEPHQQFRVLRQASPIAKKPLCPQVAKILKQRGLSMYNSIFQREEIDLYAFQLLKLQDLQQMGITNQKHCAILIQDIYYAGQYF